MLLCTMFLEQHQCFSFSNSRVAASGSRWLSVKPRWPGTLHQQGFFFCFFLFLASPTHPPLPHPLPLVRVDQYFPCSLSLMWNWLFVHSLRSLHKDLDGTAPNPNAGWPWRHQHAATGLATGLLPVWDASGKGRQVGFYNSSRGENRQEDSCQCEPVNLETCWGSENPEVSCLKSFWTRVCTD